MTGPLSRV